MWHGPLFLQTLAYQFNATASRVPIPKLGSESQGYEGAMAIAAAAVHVVPLGACLLCLPSDSLNALSPCL